MVLRDGFGQVARNVLKAVLAATALALLSAWLVLPSPAVAAAQFNLTVTLAGGGTGQRHDPHRLQGQAPSARR